MGTTVGQLLDIMKVRLAMQIDGTTNPSSQVKKATESLVEKLASIDKNEIIDIVIINPELLNAQYIRSRTGEVLAEINEIVQTNT